MPSLVTTGGAFSTGRSNLGMADRGFSAFYVEFKFANCKGLAHLETRFFDRFAEEKSAVGRATITDDQFITVQPSVAVMGGDSGVVDLKIVVLRAAKSIKPEFLARSRVPRSRFV